MTQCDIKLAKMPVSMQIYIVRLGDDSQYIYFTIIFQDSKSDKIKNMLLNILYSLLLVGAILDFIMLMLETAERNDSPTWPNSLHFMPSVASVEYIEAIFDTVSVTIAT